MPKNKFIDKKKSATFRLVFKESSAHDASGGPDRVFTRVDGGTSFVPGFSHDDQSSIFDDAEEDEEEQEEGPEQVVRKDSQSSTHPSSHSNSLPAQLRRELVELGFPDDGYNYLEHLREIGASGRSGSFVPSSNLRLDRLRADVKVYDASKVQVSRTEETGDNDALLVSRSATRIRAPTKILDPEVADLLEIDDDSICGSADELEDDFIARANEGAENSITVGNRSQQREHSDVLNGTLEDDEALGLVHSDGERQARFLDEHFDLLALREYEGEDFGELDDEDPLAHGSVHISEFDNILADFLIKDSLVQDKYQTPAELQRQNVFPLPERQSNVHDDERDSECAPKFSGSKDDTLSLLNQHSSSKKVDVMDCQSDLSEDDNELVIESDSNKHEGLGNCESVVTSYSNHKNQPCVILLKGKQQLPVAFLPKSRQRTRMDEKGTVNSSNVSVDLKGKKPSTGRRMAGERKEERKARKEAFKEEKRTARRAKKELKLLYKGESRRAQNDAAFSGPTTIPL